MIRSLRGVVTAQGKDYLVVEIGGGGGGIGLKVFVPDALALSAGVGESILLHTYLLVREDALSLYGFREEAELAMFELLLGVNGVGPKVAMATLSVLAPDALKLAILSEEPGLIARVPGVGKRTAEKIVLELRDKVKQSTGFVMPTGAPDVDTEVVDALIALGYSVVEAQRAVQRLPKSAEGVEERLRLALSQFSQ